MIDIDAAERIGTIEKLILDPDGRRVAGFVVTVGGGGFGRKEHAIIPASSVRAIMAQRLVRRLCANCRAPAELSETELRALHLEPSQMREAQVMKPVGCDECRRTGYRGRMGIFEIFVLDDDVRHMISKRTSTLMLRKRARELGMRTLREDGVRKVLAGLTSAEEVISITLGDVS